jgi:hypothetical protein
MPWFDIRRGKPGDGAAINARVWVRGEYSEDIRAMLAKWDREAADTTGQAGGTEAGTCPATR